MKENYTTCKCGSNNIRKICEEYDGLYTTATITIQMCLDCKRYRKIKTDAGEPFKLLKESFKLSEIINPGEVIMQTYAYKRECEHNWVLIGEEKMVRRFYCSRCRKIVRDED